ncbi:MAG: hypothetical protein LBF23_01850, partial [Endomicrobium sp.]|nr:hypothetical protein [Endomicrobium sp.]
QRVKEYKEVLTNILNTEISPELLASKNGRSLQKTESIVGPYELCDFFLYYSVRFGQSPDKTLFLAYKAFEGKYSKKEIKKHLINFIKRFFANQFKRTGSSSLNNISETATVELHSFAQGDIEGRGSVSNFVTLFLHADKIDVE